MLQIAAYGFSQSGVWDARLPDYLNVHCSGILPELPCVKTLSCPELNCKTSVRHCQCDIWQASLGTQDATETNVINLRRTIYLTIMSAMDFEEAGHKLLKIDLAEGQESEVVLMIIECCSQEKTYLKSAPCCV